MDVLTKLAILAIAVELLAIFILIFGNPKRTSYSLLIGSAIVYLLAEGSLRYLEYSAVERVPASLALMISQARTPLLWFGGFLVVTQLIFLLFSLNTRTVRRRTH